MVYVKGEKVEHIKKARFKAGEGKERLLTELERLSIWCFRTQK